MRRLASLTLAAAICSAVSAASAQTGPVVVIDVAEALAESAVGQELERLEAADRRALVAELDRVKAELEAEEAALVELKRDLPQEEFDSRVRAFDQRVRFERRRANERAAALERRFEEARSALRQAAQPVMIELLQRRGAAVALDRDTAVAYAPALDATASLTEELDRLRPAESAQALLPSP